MNRSILSLDHLHIGQSCRICGLGTSGTERRRMLDLGLVNGTNVEALHKSPSGDPVAYYIRGSVIALRREDAEKIFVQLCD